MNTSLVVYDPNFALLQLALSAYQWGYARGLRDGARQNSPTPQTAPPPCMNKVLTLPAPSANEDEWVTVDEGKQGNHGKVIAALEFTLGRRGDLVGKPRQTVNPVDIDRIIYQDNKDVVKAFMLGRNNTRSALAQGRRS